MKVARVTPLRSDGGRRDLLWQFTDQRWRAAFGNWTHHVASDEGTGPFCRGRLINRGAVDVGDWDVLVVTDADVMIDPVQVRHGVDMAVRLGRAVLPFDRYLPLDEQMTDRVLDGYDGTWSDGVDWAAMGAQHSHVSSVLIVPRSLWDEVGGFDERFVGWGAEDRALHRALNITAGVERVSGPVWHLWHPWSAERDESTRQYQANEALWRRYCSVSTVAELAEVQGQDVDDVLVVVVTHGRTDCIKRAIPSIDEHVHGTIPRRVISDDSGDLTYRVWLTEEYPDWHVVGDGPNVGFGEHMRRIWRLTGSASERWLFLIEDDFTFTRDVYLEELATVLRHRPHLVQMALRRQPWFWSELAAGGVVEEHPDDYTDHTDGVAEWLEHRRFFTTNPALMSTRWIARHPWPEGDNSEAEFGRRSLIGDARSGYWGPRDTDPWVIHDGPRTGVGY